MSDPRVLFIDIETAPIVAYVWSNWQTNVIATKEDWYVLSVQHKYQHESAVHFERKTKAKGNDKSVVKHAWNLLDDADVVVAHNGDRFDLPKLNARFLYYGFGLPSPFIPIDTKKEFKRHTGLASYSLKEIARYYELETKLSNSGFDLWLGCMANEEWAWIEMEEYGNQDIVVLEAVFDKIQPAMNFPGRAGNRFNAQQWYGAYTCTNCGSKDTKVRKEYRTKAGKKRAVQCQECQGWSTFKRSNTNEDTGEYR